MLELQGFQNSFSSDPGGKHPRRGHLPAKSRKAANLIENQTSCFANATPALTLQIQVRDLH